MNSYFFLKGIKRELGGIACFFISRKVSYLFLQNMEELLKYPHVLIFRDLLFPPLWSQALMFLEPDSFLQPLAKSS